MVVLRAHHEIPVGALYDYYCATVLVSSTTVFS